MDNSTRNLHPVNHANTQGNLSIPASSVTKGYTSAMATQAQNTTILTSSTNQTQSQIPNEQQRSSNTVSSNGAPMQSSSTATDNYPHQISGSGGPLATAPFLRDFSLVAEAARRAQMSVVLRDLESISL